MESSYKTCQDQEWGLLKLCFFISPVGKFSYESTCQDLLITFIFHRCHHRETLTFNFYCFEHLIIILPLGKYIFTLMNMTGMLRFESLPWDVPWWVLKHMMTSSNGNIIRVTGPLCGEFTGHRWLPLTKPVTQSFAVNSPHKSQWRRALIFSLIWAWANGWVNIRKAGDLRHHPAHYDVTVMNIENINLFPSIQQAITIWLC